ncbi:unnamed protein product [Chrysoparadoxa australica]
MSRRRVRERKASKPSYTLRRPKMVPQTKRRILGASLVIGLGLVGGALCFAGTPLQIGGNQSAKGSAPVLDTKPSQPENAGIATDQWELLNWYPHDPTSFTQGLSWWNRKLHESTGMHGRSRIMEVDLETGQMLREHRLKQEYFGEGMAIINDEAHMLTWQSKVGFRFNPLTLEPLGEFTFTTVTGQGWGITSDGDSAIVSDGGSTLTFFDPDTYAVRRQVQVTLNGTPIAHLNELEYWVGKDGKGYVLANVWFKSDIIKIDPDTGIIVDVIRVKHLA